MNIFNNLIEIKNNWQPYKKWDFEQRKKAKIDKQLLKIKPPTEAEISNAKNKGRTLITAIDIMDNSTIDKTEDINLIIKNYSSFLSLGSLGLGVVLGALMRKTKFAKNMPDFKPYWELLGLLVTSSISTVFLNIWQADTAKKASRIARFHTRKNELSDYKNFVVYTQEQLKEADKLKENLPDEKLEHKKIFNKDLFNPIKNFVLALKTQKDLTKDKIEYKEWLENYKKSEKNKYKIWEENEDKFSQADIEKAKKERDVILNVIKKIENKSNEYSTNIEMATWCLTAGITACGTIIGAALSGLISLLKKNCNFSTNANVAIRLLQFSLLTIIPGFATMIAVAPAVKLVKDSARVGRFKAKQELLNNPEAFLAYTDNERASVSIPSEDRKNASFNKRFKDDLKLALKFKDEAVEYYDYMNNTYSQELKKQKALKMIEISEEQKKEAKKIQQQLFKAFEKVDEKQVSFVEDTDAAIDILQGVGVSTIGFILRLLPVYFCAKDVKRINNGNMPQNLKEVIKVLASGKLKPITVVSVVLPFIIPSFLDFYALIKGVQVKKDAGKIGVMRAIKELEDPRNFIVNAESK